MPKLLIRHHEMSRRVEDAPRCQGYMFDVNRVESRNTFSLLKANIICNTQLD